VRGYWFHYVVIVSFILAQNAIRIAMSNADRETFKKFLRTIIMNFLGYPSERGERLIQWANSELFDAVRPSLAQRLRLTA